MIPCPHCLKGELLEFEPFVLSCYQCGYERIETGYIDWGGVEGGCVKMAAFILKGDKYRGQTMAVMPQVSR